MGPRRAIVVGGGIIGGAVAYELACQGWDVSLYERDRVGSQASMAAAGMLAPLAEAHGDGPFLRLGMSALAAYPGWLRRLVDDGARPPHLYDSGLLRVAPEETEWQGLQARLPWLESRAAMAPEPLDRHRLALREPGLAPMAGALYFPDQKHVDPPAVVAAVFDAAAARGVSIHEQQPVTRLLTSGDRVDGIETSGGRARGDVVVLCAGAWSGRLTKPLGIQLAVRPVRGQILALHQRPQPIRHIIFSHEGYLVPKAAGQVFVGATEEEAGFDASLTAEGMRWLLAAAQRLVPSLAAARFETAWAGLRPGTADGQPIMHLCQDPKGLYLCTGHFRNGILLAPAAARLVARRLDGEEPGTDEAAFQLRPGVMA